MTLPSSGMFASYISKALKTFLYWLLKALVQALPIAYTKIVQL